MASTFLSRTQGTATSRKIFTISVWVKRANLSAQQQIFETWLDNNNRFDVQFTASDKLLVQHTLGGSTSINIETSRLFRDTSAWYHIVVKVDTTQATASDRVEIYINGSQETSLSPETYPSQDLDLALGTSSYTNFLGKYSSSGGNYFDGLMTHYHFVDGTAYAASTFGETESTSGIWKPKTSPSVTYGTNGFFLKFQDSSSLGDDSSGNTNDFTLNGSGKQILDTPSNVFATFNALYNSNQNLSNGNLTATNSTSTWNSRASTLAASSGKYYAEYKVTSPGTSYHMLGVGTVENIDPSTHAGTGTGTVAIYSANGEKYVENTNTSYGNSYTTGDIIGIALDLDNNYVYFSKNGTFQNSGDPTSGSSGTGGIALPTTGTYAFTESVRSTDSSSAKVEANFGNGYFGTTAVSSAENDDAGYGKFEYDVPAGYYALCTKNINNYG